MSRNLPSTPAQNVNSSSVSRRDNSGRSNKPAVESAVTRLLVSIKQLLESLTQWSQLKIDENAVSDVYVRLGNEFNAAVQAFAAFQIDMSELLSVPDDLRAVLEQCLAEDANTENLEIYLPTVRGIITNLLQGLRGKQSVYRRIVSENRRSESASAPGHERNGSRSSRSAISSSRRSEMSHRSQRSIAESDGGRESIRRSAQSSVSSRRKEPTSPGFVPPPPPPPIINGDESFIGGFAPTLSDTRETSEVEPAPMTTPVRSPPPPDVEEEEQTPQSAPVPPTPSMAAPASMKRYSLVDKPVAAPSPAVVVEPSSPDYQPPSTPPPSTPPLESTPAMASSLAALKKSDTLERRASKRFSSYNISKMTGVGPRERTPRGQNNRRSLAASSALTASELDTLTEADEEAGAGVTRKGSGSRSQSRPATPADSAPPVPRLPSTPAKPSTPAVEVPQPITEPPTLTAPPSTTAAEPSSSSGQLTVFLQLGREVKKVKIENGITFAYLRVLFVDKFSYNPGQDNFPAIYIRDPSSGVQYELEDVEEVKDKCLLSLNIEPLDQIKQHIDAQISHLSQDIKELRNTVSTAPPPPSMIVGEPLAQSTPVFARPTDKQFQHVARRLSTFVSKKSAQQTPPSAQPQVPQLTGGTLQPQMTGGSVMSEYSTRVVGDLKTQFDEVQNLRRDLGIMRQLYTEFMKQTKDSLGNLRTQTKSVKQLATTNVGGARGYIDSGKKKLDSRSQNVLTEIEKLQDSVEGVKDDVLRKHVTPKVYFFKGIKKDIDRVSAELQSLQEHIQTVKPMWKKTWEEELQNIVEEQQFLTHQEEFLADLLEDHKSLQQVYGHIEQVINIRGSAVTPRGKGFRPPAPEEGHGGLSTVMLELQNAQVDPEKRLKAIEANQKIREKELASRSDEFEADLTDFVAGKKLKMTGGAEEAERLRQKRNDAALKAMFSSGMSINDMSAAGSAPPSPSDFT